MYISGRNYYYLVMSEAFKHYLDKQYSLGY